MMDFFNFNFMISSLLVKILYALGALVITIGGIVAIFSDFIYGIGTLIFGNLFWRLFCELIIVTFGIHDRLVSIDKKTAGTNEPEQRQV